MPAKPLSPEQIRDAERFKHAFKCWGVARKEIGEKATQEAAAAILDISQASFNDYGRGKIPLNIGILAKSLELLAFNPKFISPALYGEMEKLARLIGFAPGENFELDPVSPLVVNTNDNMSHDLRALQAAIQTTGILESHGAKIPGIPVSTKEMIQKNKKITSQ